MKRIVRYRIHNFAVAYVLAGSPAQAQTTTPTVPDQSSLGDYARKVHKDPAAKAKPKVSSIMTIFRRKTNFPSLESRAAAARPVSGRARKRPTAKMPLPRLTTIQPRNKPNGKAGRTNCRRRRIRSIWRRANSTCCKRNISFAPPPCTPTPATACATPPNGIKKMRIQTEDRRQTEGCRRCQAEA